jgi:hypothetical protein
MKQIQVYHVDAFTPNPFEGNPAGVVPDASHITVTQMQKIANQLNLPDTHFYCLLRIQEQIFESVTSRRRKKFLFAAMLPLLPSGCLPMSTDGLKERILSH